MCKLASLGKSQESGAGKAETHRRWEGAFQAQGTVTKTPSGENGLPAQMELEAVKCCTQQDYP